MVPRRRRLRRLRRRRCRTRPPTCAALSRRRLGRGRSAQVAVRAARGRAARWCAIRSALRAAFAYHPPYYHFEERATNYVDYGPQNSRGFRALKVWLALRRPAPPATAQMIADDIRLSRRDGRRGRAPPGAAARHAGAEHHDVPLRAARSSRDGSASAAVERHLDALNRALLDRLQRGGEAFVSNAVVGGRYVLRACIVNFHTDSSGRRGAAGDRGPARPGAVGRAAEGRHNIDTSRRRLQMFVRPSVGGTPDSPGVGTRIPRARARRLRPDRFAECVRGRTAASPRTRQTWRC